MLSPRLKTILITIHGINVLDSKITQKSSGLNSFDEMQ